MPKIRINQKQIKLEQERQLAEKRREFEAEYEEYQRERKEWGLDEFFPPIPKDVYVEQKCDEWLAAQPKIPSGIYKDWKKVSSECQQKFMENVQALCPFIFEELREFVPTFDRLFGNKKNYYSLIFTVDNRAFIDPIFSLFTNIRYFLSEYKIFEYEESHHKIFDHSFFWGETRLYLSLLEYKLLSKGESEKKRNVLSEITKMVRARMTIDKNLDLGTIDKGKLEKYLENVSLIIANKLVDHINNYDRYYVIENFLKQIFFAGDAEQVYHDRNNINKLPISIAPTEFVPDEKDFVFLQCELLRWTVKNKLPKDWCLRYAYFFLSKFSENPDVSVSEIEIPPLLTRSLEAYPFEFSFRGWLAGDETKENFEQLLRKDFEQKLTNYFSYTYDHLNLEEIKKLTKPINYQRVKWLVRYVIQGWSKEQIIEELDQESWETDEGRYYSNSALEKAFKELAKYDLPT